MQIDPETLKLVWKLIFKVGIIIKEGGKLHDSYKIDRQCREIIDKYELMYCRDTEQFWHNFMLLKPEEKTIFLKCFPNLFELLQQEKEYWNRRIY